MDNQYQDQNNECQFKKYCNDDCCTCNDKNKAEKIDQVVECLHPIVSGIIDVLTPVIQETIKMHNSHATLLILRKVDDLRKEREFWGEIWILEYDYYNNLTSPLREKHIFGEKLLSFGNALHTMFYSISL